MHIIRVINNIPIKTKFISIYLIFILLPMIVIYAIFFMQISKEVELRENNLIQQNFNSTYSEVQYILNGGRAITRDITIDNDINELLDETYPSSSKYYLTYVNELKDKIQRYASSYNNVVRVSMYTKNPSIINGGNVYNIDKSVQGSKWFYKYFNQGKNEQILTWIDSRPVSINYYTLNISFVRKLDTYALYNKFEKYVRVDIENSSIERHIMNNAFMDFVLLNEKGDILFSSLEENFAMKESFEQLNLDQYIEDYTIVQNTIPLVESQEWRLIGIAPKSSLLNQISRYGALISLLFVISLIFSLFMIYIFSNSYNSRIKLLQSHMQKVENSQFDIIEEEVGKDEIGYLIHSFNHMTMQINDLINEVLDFELKEKEHQLESVRAELKFLQSQMDPHFLFNTLNAILVVCNRNQYDEITDIIKYLSKILRHMIRWNDSLVSIRDEVEITKMYLHIEKFRFQDKFHFTIEVDENLQNLLIPKMIIQPFVENACKHGIQPSKNKGELQINIYASEGYLHMIIEDNGVGMSADKMKSIEKLQDDHIGIQNVYRRLKIYYDDTATCDIQSSENIGTTVHMMIPLVQNNPIEEEKLNHV